MNWEKRGPKRFLWLVGRLIVGFSGFDLPCWKGKEVNGEVSEESSLKHTAKTVLSFPIPQSSWYDFSLGSTPAYLVHR